MESATPTLSPRFSKGDQVKVTASGKTGKVAFISTAAYTDPVLVYVDHLHGQGFMRKAYRESEIEAVAS